jgi:hypothetical protein
MKSPIIIIESYDIGKYPSAKHAANHLEVQDVQDGIYEAYDSNGLLLDINIERVEREHRFLFIKWTKQYEEIRITEPDIMNDQSNELREKLPGNRLANAR